MVMNPHDDMKQESIRNDQPLSAENIYAPSSLKSVKVSILEQNKSILSMSNPQATALDQDINRPDQMPVTI